MNGPNEDTLHHLNRLKHQALQLDHPLLANELREIGYEYGAWLSGDWLPSDSEVRAFFAERFAIARHYARQTGDRCLSIALTAVEDKVLE